MRCGTCRFYHRERETTHDLLTDLVLHEEDREGPCRRYPPKAHSDSEYFGKLSQMPVLRDGYVYPVVQTTGWCGEWQAMKEQE
jgi:hypothetical protein